MSQAEVVSNSRNKIHETLDCPFGLPLFMEINVIKELSNS